MKQLAIIIAMILLVGCATAEKPQTKYTGLHYCKFLPVGPNKSNPKILMSYLNCRPATVQELRGMPAQPNKGYKL